MKNTRTPDLPPHDALPDDLADRNDPAPLPDEPPRHFIDLSATQLAGGALAAATAAWLGSRLGLAGTLAGAIIASLLTATASAVYTASLRRGRERVRAAVERVRPPASTDTSVGRKPTPASAAGRSAARPRSVAPQSPRGSGRRFGRLGARTVLVAAAAVFVTALAGITGVELVTGHALSGGRGTTVQQVGGDQPKSRPTTPGPTAPKVATSTSTAPAPNATVTVTATATPTPAPTPTGSADPTPTPTGSPTTGVSAEPTPTASTTSTPTSTP